MKRRYSLKRNKDFQRVYRQGKSQGAKYAYIVYTRSRHGSVRVGFSISKKVGNAVTRNKIKRRMKEAFRLLLKQVKKGSSIIIVARPQAAVATYAEIEKNITYLLKKSELLMPAPEESPHAQTNTDSPL